MPTNKTLVEMREQLLDELEVEILEQLKGCMGYSKTKSAVDWANIYKTIVDSRMVEDKEEEIKDDRLYLFQA